LPTRLTLRADCCRVEDLKEIAEQFGEVRDVYIPRNYYTNQPRGFAFIEFQDARACEDASYEMQGLEIEGRPVCIRCQSFLVAAEMLLKR
jgi:hypothetical protein